MACSAAAELLDDMTATDIVRDDGGTDELIRLAKLLLCQSYHHNQATEKAQEWFSKAKESAEEFLETKEIRAKNKSLQKEKKTLVEKVTLLEEDLEKESEKASRAIMGARTRKTMYTDVREKFIDLQGEHAALEEELEILRKNQTRLEEEKELGSQKLSRAEEEAKERETELESKLLEVEQKAQEREAELSNKLSEADRKAQEEIADLSDKLQKGKREARDREAELCHNLLRTEQEAQIREAKINQKLTDSEDLLKQSQERYRALQLEFKELSQSITTKDEVHRIEIQAQRSTIFLLQSELRLQQSELKENKHTQSQEESPTKIQEKMSDSNYDGDCDDDEDDDDDDYFSATWEGPTLNELAAPSESQDVAPLTQFKALDSLATYFCHSRYAKTSNFNHTLAKPAADSSQSSSRTGWLLEGILVTVCVIFFSCILTGFSFAPVFYFVWGFILSGGLLVLEFYFEEYD